MDAETTTEEPLTPEQEAERRAIYDEPVDTDNHLGGAPVPNQIVEIDYTNHRGERALRKIIPKTIEFGSTEWHPTGQWLLNAWDIDKMADRSFAMNQIHSWRNDA